MLRLSTLSFLLLLPLGFAGGYTAGPYITPTKPNIEKKSLQSIPKVDKMSFESRVKRTE